MYSSKWSTFSSIFFFLQISDCFYVVWSKKNCWIWSTCYNYLNWMVEMATMIQHNRTSIVPVIFFHFTFGINQISMKKEITNNIKWNQCHLDEIYITFSLPFRVTTEFCYVREIVCGPPCVCVRVCMDLRLSNDMVSCHSFNHVVIIVIVIIIIIIIGIGLLWRRICFMYLSCIYMSI